MSVLLSKFFIVMPFSIVTWVPTLTGVARTAGFKPHVSKTGGVHGFDDFALHRFTGDGRGWFFGCVRKHKGNGKTDREHQFHGLMAPSNERGRITEEFAPELIWNNAWRGAGASRMSAPRIVWPATYPVTQ
ncbi:MAG: hypothetical protein ABI547_05810 [Betaproteobacteria bacterium]